MDEEGTGVKEQSITASHEQQASSFSRWGSFVFLVTNPREVGGEKACILPSRHAVAYEDKRLGEESVLGRGVLICHPARREPTPLVGVK